MCIGARGIAWYALSLMFRRLRYVLKGIFFFRSHHCRLDALPQPKWRALYAVAATTGVDSMGFAAGSSTTETTGSAAGSASLGASSVAASVSAGVSSGFSAGFSTALPLPLMVARSLENAEGDLGSQIWNLCESIRQRLDVEADDGRHRMDDILCCSSLRSLDKDNKHSKFGIDELRWTILTACGLECDASGQKKQTAVDDFPVIE